MKLFKVAAVFAWLSQAASAAVIIECDFRNPARVSTMSVVEDADGYFFHLNDTDGVPLAQTLNLGSRGEFTTFDIYFPKGNGACGLTGSPANELWCKGEVNLLATATRANGTSVLFELATPWLDLAIFGGNVPNRVAYRIYGGRQLSPTQTVSGAQNGAYSGPVCRR